MAKFNQQTVSNFRHKVNVEMDGLQKDSSQTKLTSHQLA
jgi:hypothetical protein